MTPAGDVAEEARRPFVARVVRGAASGAVAGLVGTLGMSLLMLPAQRIGLLGTQPPRRMSDRAFDTMGLGRRVDERERRLGTSVTHLGIGAVAGAALGGFRGALDGPRLTPVVGTAFGAAFWALAYVVVAPAIELFPRPDRDRPGRPPVMLAAHIIYGIATATLIEAFLGDQASRPSASPVTSASMPTTIDPPRFKTARPIAPNSASRQDSSMKVENVV